LRAAELLFLIGNPLYQSLDNFVPSQAMRILLDRGLPAFRRYMLRWTLVGLAVSMAITLVGIAAPGLWLALVFGPQMTEYANLVYALAPRSPILMLIIMGYIVLRSRDATAFGLASEAARAIVTVATVYPIVASFGILGTALAHALWPLAGLAVLAVGVYKSVAGLSVPAGVKF
jgi:O-antigen/teichoic acid export membrane protein